LRCRDWITKVIYGTAQSPSVIFDVDRRGYVYRLVAYHHGAAALDEFLAALSGGSTSSGSPANGPSTAGPDVATAVRAQALMAIATLEVTAKTADTLINLALQLQSEKAKPGEASTQDDVAAKILATLEKNKSSILYPRF
jgi:hypothetical protein